jgi:hypothetical protein
MFDESVGEGSEVERSITFPYFLHEQPKQPGLKLVLPGVRKDSVEGVMETYRFSNRILGEGAFGKVIRGNSIQENMREVAIKVVDIQRKGVTTSLEVVYLRQLKYCGNVVTLLDAFQVNGHLCLVMEVAIGNLADIVRSKLEFYKSVLTANEFVNFCNNALSKNKFVCS